MNRAETLRAQAPVTLFYDGRCPLCRKEVDWLAGHRHSDRVIFVDIRAEGFDAAALGTTFTEMMGRLHVLDAQGRWYIGMDASRALYAVLGYRRLIRLSLLPGLAPLMDAGYLWFARRRVRLGRWITAWNRRRQKSG